jgi:polyhydroxybutyrate depolymerase
MKRRTLLLIGLVALSLLVAGCGRGRRAATAETALIEMILEHGGLERKAFVHLPPEYDDQTPLPLILAFHGGGGRGEQYARFTKLDTLADEEGFIVVFPEGVEGHWYDERFAEAFGVEGQEIDDVGFTLALLEALKQAYAIDRERVYATGTSNGGIFCQQLAIEATEHFAAVASVTAQIPDVSAYMIPQGEISVLLMNGTDDPLVPYGGGADRRGTILIQKAGMVH